MQDISFTFGIITAGTEEACGYLDTIIASIERLNVPQYEILIVGDTTHVKPRFESKPNMKFVHFSPQRSGWITKKKNLITQHATYENVVYQHDYLTFEPDWYEGYKEFGSNFHICMNKIIQNTGERFRDWTLWGEPVIKAGLIALNVPVRSYLLPYDETSLTKYQYISGAYWVAKKSVMAEFKLDENLMWGQGEDVYWSQTVREKYAFSINPNSTVKCLKKKNPTFARISKSDLKRLKEYIKAK